MTMHDLLSRLGPPDDGPQTEAPVHYGESPWDWPVLYRGLRQIAEDLVKLSQGEPAEGPEAHWAVFFWTLVQDAAKNQTIVGVAEIISELERRIIGDENGESAATIQAQRLLDLLRGEFISRADHASAMAELRAEFETRLGQVIAQLPKAKREALAKKKAAATKSSPTPEGGSAGGRKSRPPLTGLRQLTGRKG